MCPVSHVVCSSLKKSITLSVLRIVSGTQLFPNNFFNFRLVCSDRRHMTIMWKKESCRALGNKTPDRNHPAQFMPWEKASEQRRKFCCGAHWVKKGERPINRLGHREEEQWAARRGAPTAAEPRIPTHTPTHTYTHTLIWKGASEADVVPLTSQRAQVTSWGEEKGERRANILLPQCWIGVQGSDKLLRLCSFQVLTVSTFYRWCTSSLSVTRPDLFQINEISFVICTSFAQWEPWRRMWIQDFCWGGVLSRHDK